MPGGICYDAAFAACENRWQWLQPLELLAEMPKARLVPSVPVTRVCNGSKHRRSAFGCISSAVKVRVLPPQLRGYLQRHVSAARD